MSEDYKPTPLAESLAAMFAKHDQQHAEAVMMVGHLNKLRQEARKLAWNVVDGREVRQCLARDNCDCIYCKAKAFLKASGGEDVR